MNPFNSGATFLIATLFNLYVLVLVLRFIAKYFNANMDNPVANFVMVATDPLCKPIADYLPDIAGIETVSVFVALAVEFVKYFLLSFLSASLGFDVIAFLVMAIGDLLIQVATVFIYAIIIVVVLRMLMPQTMQQPIVMFLVTITEPLLAPARKLIPLVGGFDLSPLAVLIVLWLIQIIIFNPIFYTGLRMGMS